MIPSTPPLPRRGRRTDRMIPVFVIYLPDCRDRRARVSAALDGLNLPFEFVDAVDGRRGLPPEYESQIDRPKAREPGKILSDAIQTDAEFACALSHINVYRRIVSENIDHALVLEDDAVPQPDLAGYLAGKHYEGAELTQLYHYDGIYVRRAGARSVFGGYRSYLRAPMMKVTGAGCYVISHRAAKHFADGALPVTCAADWPECTDTLIARRECRVVSPSLVRLEGASIIDAAGRANKAKRRFLGVYVPPFRSMARSLKRAPLKPFSKRLRANGT